MGDFGFWNPVFYLKPKKGSVTSIFCLLESLFAYFIAEVGF
jgi:hypothetical protein